MPRRVSWLFALPLWAVVMAPAAAHAAEDLRLIDAIQRGDARLAATLLKQGLDANAATPFGITPLAIAASAGSSSLIRLLVQAGADPNHALPSGETPLMIAAKTGQPDAVRALLAAGADANRAEPAFSQTALMWAAAEGHVAAIQALIEAGADLHARSRSGFTPLLFAVRDGQFDALRALAAAGADVRDSVRADMASQTDRMDMGPDGSSALALAIMNARYDIGVWLLDQGVDANVRDPRGSFLHTLVWMRRPGKNASPRLHKAEPAGVVTSLDLMKALLAHGADPNVRIAWEERKPRVGNATSFAYGRSPGNMDVGISFMSFVGATPFYLAARSGDVAVMRLLVAYGANPLTPTEKGITPLMAAAGVGYYNGQSPGPEWGGIEDAEVLEGLELTWLMGNDINAVMKDEVVPPDASDPSYALDHPTGQFDIRWGRSTALHGAVLRESPMFIKLLVDKGAKLDARNQLGWTPLSVAAGLFTGGTFRQYPELSALLRRLMTERNIDPSDTIVCTICRK